LRREEGTQEEIAEWSLIIMANKPHASNPAIAVLISTLSHRRGVADAGRSP
jgi:hypothetical protein